MRRIRNIIQKILYRFGFQLEKVLNPKDLKKKIVMESKEVQMYELKKYSHLLETINDVNSYNDLLKSFVPSLNINLKNTRFIGKGTSMDSLNTYREVMDSHISLFEKVYYSKSPTLKKMKWFEKNIFPFLRKEIIISPKIVKMFSSSFLTIAYFEYIDSPTINPDEEEKVTIDISKFFYKFSLRFFPQDLLKSIPENLLNYKNHGKYKRWIGLATKEMEKVGLDIQTIEDKLDSIPKIFTHGDLKYPHLYINKTVIDWDESGFYPIGFEQAYIAYRSLVNGKLQAQSVISWLTENFGEIRDEVGVLMELSFCYFLIVFMQVEFQKDNFLESEKVLIMELKKRLN